MVALSFLLAPLAQAQVIIGGNSAPNVVVDWGVLDGLGPAPTLPQLFGESHRPAASPAPAPAATKSLHPHTLLEAKSHASPHPGHSAAPHLASRPHPAKHKLAHHKASSASKLAAANKPHHLAAAHAPAPAVPATAHAVKQAAAQPPDAAPLRDAADAASAPSSGAITPLQTAPVQIAAVPPTPPSVPTAQTVPAPAPIEAAPSPPPPQTLGDIPPPLAIGRPLELAKAAAGETPAPATSEAAAAPPAPIQVASVATMGSAVNAIRYAPGATELPANSPPVLDALAAKLIAEGSLRVQLVAHASGGIDQAMEARRVSLARAIAIRAYLIAKGVAHLRVDVRALGNRGDQGPAADQVDLVIVGQ